MASPNNTVVKGTKDYNAKLDETASKILTTDKFNAITATLGEGEAFTNSSATLQENGDLLIRIGYNSGGAKTKEVTVQGYAKNGKVSNPVKYLNFVDAEGGYIQYNLSDFAKDDGIHTIFTQKGINVAGSVIGDTIDLTAIGNRGYLANAGLGDDVVTSSAGNDTITGGKGENILNLSLDFGDDIVTLTKDEKLYINLPEVAEPVATANQAGWEANVSAELIKNNLKLTFKDGANVLGTVTIKDYKTSDITGAQGDVILRYNGNDQKDFSLKNWDFEKDLGQKETIFTGTWINDDIDGTNVEQGRSLTINAGNGNNIITGHSGNDTITAGSGHDEVTATSGNDNYKLGTGRNTITYAANNNGKDIVNLTNGEILTLDISAIEGINDLADIQNALSFKGSDLVIQLSAQESITVKSFKTTDVYNAKLDKGDLILNVNTYGAVSLRNSTHAGIYVPIFKKEMAANEKSFTGTYLNDVVKLADGAQAASKVAIDLGQGNNTIVAGTGVANETVKAGTGNDFVAASKGSDIYTLGAGLNQYTALATNGVATEDRDIITLTKGETLVIQTGLTTENSAVHYAFENNDLVISSNTNNFKTIVIKGFKTSLVGDVYISTTDKPAAVVNQVTGEFNPGQAINLRTSHVYDEIGVPQTGNAVNGTKLSDVVNLTGDGTVGKKGYVISTFEGDDVINLSKGNDTITAGLGENVINVKTGEGEANKFGENIVNLTKGENLTVQLDTNENGFVDYNLVGKDLVITVYDNADNHSIDHINGKLTVKNYATADKLGAGTFEIVKANGTQLVDLKTHLYSVDADKPTITGGWLNEKLDAKNYEIVDYKGVSIAGAQGDDVIIGSSGYDTISGGTGKNKFIYQAGNGGKDTVIVTKTEEIVIQYNDNVQGAIATAIGDSEGQEAIDKVFTIEKSGSDIILKGKVEGFTSDKITIKNAAALNMADLIKVQIADKDGEPILNKAVNFVNKTDDEAEEYIFTNRGTERADGSVSITGSNLDEKMEGSVKADSINAVNGTNEIDGKGGGDKITAGLGKDTIKVGENYGTTTVNSAASADVLHFKNFDNEGELKAGVEFFKDKNDLKIKYGANDAVTIKNWYAATDRLEVLEALNGDQIRISEEMADPNRATNIKASGIISGTTGKDYITGSKGADTITAYEGDDTIDGAGGSDIIRGGKGANVVITGKGYGKTTVIPTEGEELTIEYHDSSNTGIIAGAITSQAKFKENFDVLLKGTTLYVTRLDNEGKLTKDVVIISNATAENADKIMFKAYDKEGNASAYIPDFKVTSGDNAYIFEQGRGGTSSLRLTGTSFNENFNGSSAADVISTGAGNDTVHGAGGNDTITVNAEGEKLINIGEDDGNDTIILNDTIGKVTVDFNYDGAAIQRAEIKNSTDLAIKTATPEGYKVTTIKNYVAHKDDVDLKVNSILVNPTLYVAPSGNTYNGTDLNEFFEGSNDKTKADNINTAGGNDTITAGKGDDLINITGAGEKLVNINKGDGSNEGGDIISIQNYDAVTSLKFDGNALNTFREILAKKASNNKDLILERIYNDAEYTREQTTIKNFFTDSNMDADKIVIQYNGQVMVLSDLIAGQGGIRITGEENENNVLKGTDRDDLITGGELLDTITTGAGFDRINPKRGNDLITIDGAGQKLININTDGGNDTISFTEDADDDGTTITYTELTAEGSKVGKAEIVNGTDLALTVGGKETIIKDYAAYSDKVNVKNNYEGGVQNALPETFEVRAKGTTFIGSKFDETFAGGDSAETFTTGAGNDTITASTGNDTITVNDEGAKTVKIGKNDGNDVIGFSEDAQDNKTTIKFTENDVTENHKQEIANGTDLIVTTTTAQGTKETTILNYVDDKDKIAGIVDKDGDSLLTGYSVRGKEGTYTGSVLNETFTGTGAAETFITGGGTDTLTAGLGNDTISITGEAEEDILINIAKEDGDDTIELSNPNATAKVQFTDAAASDATTYLKSGNNLIIQRYWDEGDGYEQNITIKNFFSDAEDVPKVKVSPYAAQDFVDVTTKLTNGQNDAIFVTYQGSAEGSFTDDKFIGSGEADTISTGAGYDIVDGKAGDDVINITGAGTKNILIKQGEGNDLIKMNLDEDNTLQTVLDVDYTHSEGFAHNHEFVKNGNDLEIITTSKKAEEDDVVDSTTIKDYFKYDANQDGSKLAALTVDDINVKQKLTAATSDAILTIDKSAETQAQTIAGTSYGEIIYGSEGNDSISTGKGKDIIYAGEGNDIITVNGDGVKTINISTADGNDTIVLTEDTQRLNINFGTYNAAPQGEQYGAVTYESSPNGQDLIINVEREGGIQKLTVQGYFANENTLSANKIMLSTNNGETFVTDVYTAVNTNGTTINLAEYAEDEGVEFAGTNFKDSVTGSEFNDTIYTLNAADTINAALGDDSIIISGTGVKKINIDSDGGNDTITVEEDIEPAVSEITIGNKEAANPKFRYTKTNDDLIISRSYDNFETVEGTTTIEDYFTGADNLKATKLNGYGLNQNNQHLKKDGVTITGIEQGNNLTFAGSEFADTITGSDTKKDVISDLSSGNDELTLGKGDAEITVLTTDSGNKTINIDRADGNNMTTISLSDGAQGAVVRLVVQDREFYGIDGYKEPTIAYMREGRDLVATITHAGIDGEIYLADEVIQTVVVENYFNENKDTAQTATVLKHKINEQAEKTVATQDLTSATFIVSDGTLNQETGIVTLNGTTYGETLIGTDGKDIIRTNTGADIIETFKGQDTVEINGNGQKTIMLARNTASDSITVTGLENTNKTIVNFGTYNDTEDADSMEFVRIDNDLKVTTNYTQLGKLSEGVSNLLLKDFFAGNNSNNVYYSYKDSSGHDTGHDGNQTLKSLINAQYAEYTINVNEDLAANFAIDTTNTYAKININVAEGVDASTDGHITKTNNTADTYVIETGTEATVTLADSNGNDTYTVKGEGSAIIADAGNGNDIYRVAGGVANITDNGSTTKNTFTVLGGEVTINNIVAGVDEYTIYNGQTTVTEDKGGADKYSIYNGTLTITKETAGGDNYAISNGTLTIEEETAGDDEYLINGGQTTIVNEKAGWDEYTVEDGKLTITSETDGSDTYNVKGGELVITDEKDGDDEYTIKGNATIKDSKGEDIYDIIGGTISINDLKDDDIYNITTQWTKDVTIHDTDGDNTIKVSNKSVEELQEQTANSGLKLLVELERGENAYTGDITVKYGSTVLAKLDDILTVTAAGGWANCNNTFKFRGSDQLQTAEITAAKINTLIQNTVSWTGSDGLDINCSINHLADAYQAENGGSISTTIAMTENNWSPINPD